MRRLSLRWSGLIKPSILSAFVLLVITVAASQTSPTINYASGFTAAGITLNGTASLDGTRLSLTNAADTDSAGSAFVATPVNVQSFTSDFSFQLTNADADGMAFVIQNNGATALGAAGSGLGYGPYTAGAPAYAGLSQSVAIKFDLYDNSGEGSDSTGLYIDGAAPTVPALDLTSSGVNLHSGDIFNVHLTYDGTTLTMTITDAGNSAQTFTTSWPINIPATVGGSTAFVGFTGGSGELTATQEILSWTYNVTFTAVDFDGGFTPAGMQLNGASSLNGTRLRLTDATTNYEGGSAFFTTPVNVQSFASDFSFQLTNAEADGVAFVIQNNGATALGPVGGGLGYGPETAGASPYAGLNQSVAIKFDLYNNSGEGIDSTGLYSDGASPTVPALDLTSSGVNLHSGDIFNVHLSYDGATLSMTITDASNPSQTFTSGWPINLPSIVGGNTALVGFTGSTGGLTAVQEVLTWTYTVTSPPPSSSSSPPPPAHSITFSWSPPAGVISGYNVLCGSQSGGPYSILNTSLLSAPPYKDMFVQAGQTYYCVAESVLDDLESVYSNEVRTTIPSP